MAIEKKPTLLPPEVIAAAKERSAQARKKLEEVGRSNLHTRDEKANAAPFYFVLRNYLRQLKAAREAARLTLTEVATRSGLALESLSRLETGAQTNPTWRTLGMYAAAIGCAPVLSIDTKTDSGPTPISVGNPTSRLLDSVAIRLGDNPPKANGVARVTKRISPPSIEGFSCSVRTASAKAVLVG